MTITLAQLRNWLTAPFENEHLEFKEARNRFDFEKLVTYCVALANEGGGHMILGVTDKLPRQVVGTKAFQNPERTKAGLLDRLHLRIFVEEVVHPKGRVLVFEIPSRPIGMPVQYKGTYWMRGGEYLVPMTPDMLKRIFDESGPDFSAEICPNTGLADLAPEAIERFRAIWVRRSGNHTFRKLTSRQFLEDAELLVDGDITIAALILLGSQKVLSRHLAQAEIVYE